MAKVVSQYRLAARRMLERVHAECTIGGTGLRRLDRGSSKRCVVCSTIKETPDVFGHRYELGLSPWRRWWPRSETPYVAAGEDNQSVARHECGRPGVGHLHPDLRGPRAVTSAAGLVRLSSTLPGRLMTGGHAASFLAWLLSAVTSEPATKVPAERQICWS